MTCQSLVMGVAMFTKQLQLKIALSNHHITPLALLASTITGLHL